MSTSKEQTYTPADRTDQQIENERLFGPFMWTITVGLIPAHLISAFCCMIAVYGWADGQIAALGVSGYWLTMAMAGLCVLIAFVSSVILELLHHYVPKSFFWLLLKFKTTTKDRPRLAFFLLLGGLVVLITVMSKSTSAGGADTGARLLHQEPDTVTLTDLVQDYRADTLNINQVYADQVDAVNKLYRAKADSAAAPYNEKIAKLRTDVARWAQLNPAAHKWAPGSVKQGNASIKKLIAERDAAVKTVTAGKLSALSRVSAEAADDRRAARMAYTGTKQQRQDKYRTDLERARQATEARASAWSGIATWAVLAILILEFIQVLYDYSAGKQYRGFAYAPKGTVGKYFGGIWGMVSDKFERAAARAELTRTVIADRDPVKPWALPRGRTVLSLVVGLVGIPFAVMQIASYSADQYSRAQIIPFPFDWGLLLFCVVVIGVNQYRNKTVAPRRQVVGPSATTDQANADKSDKSPDKSPKLSEKPDKSPDKTDATVVGQRFEGDGEPVASLSAEDINRLKDQFRHSQVRQHTSARPTTRRGHADKYAQAVAALKSVGYQIVPSNEFYEGNHKIDGQVKRVRFRLYKWVRPE